MLLNEAKHKSSVESDGIISSQVGSAKRIASDLVGRDLDSIERHVKAKLRWIASSHDVHFMRQLKHKLLHRLTTSYGGHVRAISLELEAAAAKGRAQASAVLAAKALAAAASKSKAAAIAASQLKAAEVANANAATMKKLSDAAAKAHSDAVSAAAALSRAKSAAAKSKLDSAAVSAAAVTASASAAETPPHQREPCQTWLCGRETRSRTCPRPAHCRTEKGGRECE